MTMGKVKKMFPGNNTSEGFFSFYHYIINPDGARIFILKGGPGVGKSSMMKRIGAVMSEKGFEVEYHFCSSDNNSLDGVVIPSLRMAILDGTAPHLVDPKNPGAVDVIVNLGEFWDEKVLLKAKEEIINLNKKKGRMFQLAYSHLKEAKVAHDELESYFREAQNQVKVNKLVHEVSTALFSSIVPQFNRPTVVRHLFASANTPKGYVHYLDSILQDVRNLYLLNGAPGTGKEEFLAALYRMGTGLGFDCEVYHCPFEPAKFELVYFSDLGTAFLRLNELLEFDPAVLPKMEICKTFEFDEYLNEEIVKAYAREITEAENRISHLKKKAWEKLMSAKMFHDELEQLYIPAMDFETINKKSEEILNSILSYK